MALTTAELINAAWIFQRKRITCEIIVDGGLLLTHFRHYTNWKRTVWIPTCIQTSMIDIRIYIKTVDEAHLWDSDVEFVSIFLTYLISKT
jgi:hypothetical protein